MGDIFQFHLLLSLVGTLVVTAFWCTGIRVALWAVRWLGLASSTVEDGKQDSGRTLPCTEAQADQQQPQEVGV